MEYWVECIGEAFDDAQITASEEQIRTVASWVEGAHDNYGLATGSECIANPLTMENTELKKQLKRELDKTICPECHGQRRLVTHGPCHSAESDCYVCHGTGYIYHT